jgi:hypothetical protein
VKVPRDFCPAWPTEEAAAHAPEGGPRGTPGATQQTVRAARHRVLT